MLGRTFTNEIMTIYVPTFLIMAVSYLTTFFDNKLWFGHIITINLTAREAAKKVIFLWQCKLVKIPSDKRDMSIL